MSDNFTVSYTPLPNGHAICILAAPRDGSVRPFARFESHRNAAPPSSAFLSGTLNGVSIGNKADSDFNDTKLVIDGPSIPVSKNATLTFETIRGNHDAVQTAFEMTLSFV